MDRTQGFKYYFSKIITPVIFLIGVFICANTSFAQDWEDEEEEEEESSPFFVGINAGAFFANNNTAAIYTGSSDLTDYGIDYILDIQNYKPVFDAYFDYNNYTVEETPQNPTYKTAFNIGLHAGVNVSKINNIYIDINYATLKFEQVFTIAIDDPVNQSIQPTYEQFPILGEEKRININLGTQLSLYKESKTNIYWAIFGNFNSIELERNYFVIDGREYEIIHSNPQMPYVAPGGIGYGGGSGLGIQYKLTDNIKADLTYNLYYIKTKMNENIQGFGLNHGITFRLIWN